jgi:hypothetical protein
VDWAQRWRRRGNAHWQTKADIPFSPHGCAASLLWVEACTYRCQTPDSSQIIIDRAVLAHRHRLCLAACQAVTSVADSCLGPWLQSSRGTLEGSLCEPLLSTTASRPQAVRLVMGAPKKMRCCRCQACRATERACAAPRPSRRSACFFGRPACRELI